VGFSFITLEGFASPSLDMLPATMLSSAPAVSQSMPDVAALPKWVDNLSFEVEQP
jgi:hypothetical protein